MGNVEPVTSPQHTGQEFPEGGIIVNYQDPPAPGICVT